MPEYSFLDLLAIDVATTVITCMFVFQVGPPNHHDDKVYSDQ